MVMKSNNSKACAMQVGDTEFAIPKFSKMSSLKSLQVTQVFTILHILSRNNSETLASQALPTGSQDSGGQRSVLQSRIWEEGVLQEQGGTSYRLLSEQHQNLRDWSCALRLKAV